MQVIINQHPFELLPGASLANALEAYAAHAPFAAAVNGVFVAQRDYPQHLLKEGDCIDVVQPVMGG
ncbi:sulfur carrier protein ThiS [Mycoavidus sp. B2-EB]|uniref:sulfur carrier protein ThiS n=1 Tax=Mycoavidus sp. B2-EB TaxID=2651972 RepID=UPI001626D2A5|nr:sulfur carrier protein ThiS [Mycoavidus sp. B2-EB]BBO59813.1 thiamine biosynthesis protein ThiS [Mycoavidus sp. B2-EB]